MPGDKSIGFHGRQNWPGNPFLQLGATYVITFGPWAPYLENRTITLLFKVDVQMKAGLLM